MKAFALAASVLAANAASAGDDPMASRYGNTTVVTRADGTIIRLWYNADHSWSGVIAGATQVGGTWTVDDGTLCVTYTGTPPPGAVNPNCSPAMDREVGDHWTVGEGATKMEVTLVAGNP